MLSVRLSLLFSRHASRSARSGKHLQAKERNSRGSQIGEIHRRLAEFELCQSVSTQLNSRYEVDSIIAEGVIQKEREKFAKVLERREVEKTVHTERVGDARKKDINFPLAKETKVDHMSTISRNLNPSCIESLSDDIPLIDRGFYVQAGEYVDEYVAGTTYELPEDEMNAPTRMVFGPEDAVEHIDFQLPGQNIDMSNNQHSANEPEFEWSEQFGTVDPERKESFKKCGGCGACFHCKDNSLPGFLPMEIFDRIEKKKSEMDILCKRCHLLKHHNFLLNLNVCPVDYASMMSHLKMKEEVLILLVVDVTDIHGSIHRQLPNIIGYRKSMIVVANKVDVLPPDARCGYLKNFKITVEKAISDAGFSTRFNVLHTALVSAKTGYGIEDLITEIHMKWTNVKLSMRSDIYLVGCTNVGKSTLFNAFLQSDLCKVRAVDLVERATTSVWPGTTISLLKFPVMKLAPYRLELRRRRLLANRAWLQRENYVRKRMLQETGDNKYAVLTGTIQNTYKEQEDDLQPISAERLDGEETTSKRSWSLNDEIFTKGTWCYDTPGTVNSEQVVNLFTLSELVRALPRSLLTPRTALVSPGSSLLVGGIGVVDVVRTTSGNAIYLTVFASDNLPLNVIPTEKVENFLNSHQVTGALVVPEGGEDRMAKFPKLVSREFTLKGVRQQGTVDLVLSSIGWVMVTSLDRSISVRVATPEGRGIVTRDPILPYSASLRGKRIPGTQFYKVSPVKFPVNEKRNTAKKNKIKFKEKKPKL